MMLPAAKPATATARRSALPVSSLSAAASAVGVEGAGGVAEAFDRAEHRVGRGDARIEIDADPVRGQIGPRHADAWLLHERPLDRGDAAGAMHVRHQEIDVGATGRDVTHECRVDAPGARLWAAGVEDGLGFRRCAAADHGLGPIGFT